MEQEQHTQVQGEKHICKTGNCCDGCCGCACHSSSKRGYWVRRFLVLIIGVLLAFWCGYKLGMIKGIMVTGLTSSAPTAEVQ